MRTHRAAPALVVLLAGALAPRPAGAQSAPWRAGGPPGQRDPGGAQEPRSQGAEGGAARTPGGGQGAAGAGAQPFGPVVPPGAGAARVVPLDAEPYGDTPDPSTTHHFQMPTARPLRYGDAMVTVAGYLGWIGARYGFSRRFDAGVGVPIYLAGLSVDARYLVASGDGVALSVWGYASIPFMPGGVAPTDYLGFTWQGSGAAWVLGPLVSVWSGRAGLHVGVHVAQRTLLGGAWLLAHATVEGRLADSVRVIAQGVVLGEVADEGASGAHARAFVGNAQPRVLPYLVAGVRLHSRKFAVDFGALASFAPAAPLSTGGFTLWPWTSISMQF